MNGRIALNGRIAMRPYAAPALASLRAARTVSSAARRRALPLLALAGYALAIGLLFDVVWRAF